VKRRDFITLLGGAAAWPLAARAQQGERVRRVGVLMGFDENNPEVKGWLSGFMRGLAELGWTDGRNVQMEVRWAAGNPDRMRIFAKELVDLQSDVILSQTTPVTAALHRETRTIPIIFVMVADPVGAGFAASVPRPGGNLTGFIVWEPSVAGKWLELLTDVAPGVGRVSIMFNPDTAPYIRSYLPSFEAAARSPFGSLLRLRGAIRKCSIRGKELTMRKNELRKIIADGKTVLNAWLAIANPFSAELMAHQGFDAVTIDLQHGPVDFQAAVGMLAAISTTPAVPMVRVPWNEPILTAKLLDAGAYGVICPMINSKAEAEALVCACRYPPRGARSFGPNRALLYSGADYWQHANDEVLVFAMVETREAVKHLDEIVSVEGLNGVYVGPYPRTSRSAWGRRRPSIRRTRKCWRRSMSSAREPASAARSRACIPMEPRRPFDVSARDTSFARFSATHG
jgi:2-keto-3-deoxy-L-rhamnonate aldolase RhmA